MSRECQEDTHLGAARASSWYLSISHHHYHISVSVHSYQNKEDWDWQIEMTRFVLVLVQEHNLMSEDAMCAVKLIRGQL